MRRHRRGRSATTSAPNTGTAKGSGPAHEPRAGDERAAISGYRLLRRLASGDRAAIFLANSLHTADGESSSRAVVALRIYEAGCDDALVAAEIAAMTADATGTLPALIDVTALDDGRCVLAVERLAGPTLARLLTERALEPGEAVTILAPIAVAVAGLAEAGFVHTRLAPNDVIIDGVGRPRLIGLGAIRRLDEVSSAIERTELIREGHAALSDLVAGVAEVTRPPGSLDRAVAAIRDAAAARPFVRSEALLERTLFESAAAAPVRGVPAGGQRGAVPGRVAESTGSGLATGPVESVRHGLVDDPTQRAVAAPTPRRGLLSTLAALAQVPAEAVERGADLADVDPVTSFAARCRRALAARRRTVLVAALVGGAALVLLLALVPPADQQGVHDAGDTAAAAAGAAAGPASPAPASEGAVISDRGSAPGDGSASGDAETTPGADGASIEDPVEATAELLARREDCFAALDTACLQQVNHAGSTIERADLGLISGAREGAEISPVAYSLDAVAIIAEMGDAVLMTLPYADPEREPASLLVMRSEAGWRLREIFD
ncbi:hypothetical protein [Agromyces italicus]|uniref:hypothetical protein n=1 Tax=Agromyces italicus TaxID=279572 RepID=UPI0003B4D5CD|nr:hypothetical protein [Agromyces italicus]